MLNWEDDTPVAPVKVMPTPVPEVKPTLVTPKTVNTPLPNEAIAPLQASPELAQDRRVNVADKRIINGQTDLNGRGKNIWQDVQTTGCHKKSI